MIHIGHHPSVERMRRKDERKCVVAFSRDSLLFVSEKNRKISDDIYPSLLKTSPSYSSVVESLVNDGCPSSNHSSIQITEFFEFLPTTSAPQSPAFDDNADQDGVDTHRLLSSDTNELMEEDNDE